jgi:hypothetical protein
LEDGLHLFGLHLLSGSSDSTGFLARLYAEYTAEFKPIRPAFSLRFLCFLLFKTRVFFAPLRLRVICKSHVLRAKLPIPL